MGIDDFVVLDRGNDLGGTWRDNSYPGCCCDVPSNLYSFSFALNPDWSRVVLRRRPRSGTTCATCVDRFDVGGQLRFDHAVDEARWDDERRALGRAHGRRRGVPSPRCWSGRPGSLSEPSIPDFPGLDELPRQGLPLGPLGARLRPGAASGCASWARVPRPCSSCRRSRPVVEHLYLHQRTPPWIVPRARPGRLAPAQAGLPQGARPPAPVPAAHLRHVRGRCSRSSSGRGERRKAAVRKAALDHLARQVPDEALRRKLDAALRAGLQAPAPLRRLLPLAHPLQRGGGGLTGRVVHRPRGGGAGRHRPPGRRGHHGHRLRGRRAALRRAHRRAATAAGSRRCGRPTASRPTPAPRWPGSPTCS